MIPFVAALTVGLGIFAVFAGLHRRNEAQREILAAVLDAELAEPTRSPESLADLVAAAGSVTERVLGRTSMLDSIGLQLTRAGWSLRAGEFVGVVAAMGVGTMVVVWMMFGSLIVAMSGGVVVTFGGLAWLGRAGRVRVRKIEDQLPGVLQLLAGSLEAGSSVLHAFELVVEEGDPPLASELARVVAETKVGRPLLESLEAVAERVGSRDLDWTVEAIRIQQQTGGKLADTLRVLADFMRARLEVRGEVRALSAEARLSAKVLTALPIVIGGFMFMFRRAYFQPLLETTPGRVMLVVGLSGMVIGSYWMRRIVRVEV
jgi:tight adherence protein B